MNKYLVLLCLSLIVSYSVCIDCSSESSCEAFDKEGELKFIEKPIKCKNTTSVEKIIKLFDKEVKISKKTKLGENGFIYFLIYIKFIMI